MKKTSVPAQAWRFTRPVPYARCAALQEKLLALRLEGAIPDTVLFVEHPPTVTLGRRKRDQHLKLSLAEYQRRGIEVVASSRGGDVTYHAPGQLVMYPILKLGVTEADAHGYLYNLEEVALRTAESFEVPAWRRARKNGAWTDRGKIAAIGFRIKHWVTCHGMSFNNTIDLEGFNTIVPCGLVGEAVTSLAAHRATDAPSLPDLCAIMAGHFETVCQRTFSDGIRSCTADDFPLGSRATN